ncbi:MAG TPA: MBL fold metallo-hydrolase [Candidatus Marinimicrobia bacterium]|nr:MBL fold metallo-hydrolase [Candidatus Neomarinimicrobiota bacterium]
MIHVDTLITGVFQTNTYFLTESGETLIIDPGDRLHKIEKYMHDMRYNPVGIFCTHAHLDHIVTAPSLMKKFNIPVFLHEMEKNVLESLPVMCRQFHMPYYGQPDPVKWLRSEDRLMIGHFDLPFRHTPGHTPGGLALMTDVGVFSGDTIFYGSVGRTDFPGGNGEILEKSIRSQIYTLEDETVLWPGHGPKTTVGHEKKYNPYVHAF